METTTMAREVMAPALAGERAEMVRRVQNPASSDYDTLRYDPAGGGVVAGKFAWIYPGGSDHLHAVRDAAGRLVACHRLSDGRYQVVVEWSAGPIVPPADLMALAAKNPGKGFTRKDHPRSTEVYTIRFFTAAEQAADYAAESAYAATENAGKSIEECRAAAKAARKAAE